MSVILFTGWTLYLTQPPRPLQSNAPATSFSAERAIREAAIIAQRPHSIGTVDHDRVRDYLVQRCRALGLAVTIQDTTIVRYAFGSLVGGRVQNVVANLPGRKPGGPVVLVLSHYDSQPHTPGASDDGAGIAASLETLRALHAGLPLEHDVRWVFTDGEEVGLLGASAYVASIARLRREIGVVFNFEARGNEGASFLFEVNPGNEWIVGEFAKAAPVPFASSLFYEIYRHLPNDTDFTAFRAAGIQGLNFAFTGGYSYYHSPADTPDRLDLGALQHQGEYMLPLVRHFASIPLVHTTVRDSTFFNPLGTWLVLYDASWNYLLNGGVALLLLIIVRRAQQQGRIRLKGLLLGSIAWVGALLLLFVMGWILIHGLPAAYPQYEVFYDHAFYNVRSYHLVFVALGTAIFGTYYSILLKWLRPDSLIGGVLLLLALLQGILQIKAITSTFLLGFPLLFGSLSWLWSMRTLPKAENSMQSIRFNLSNLGWMQWLLVLPAVALLAPTLSLLLNAAGLGPLLLINAIILAILLGFLLPTILPVLHCPTQSSLLCRWAFSIVAGIVAIAALLAGHISSVPTALQPQQTHVLYMLDNDHSQAHWISNTPHADSWTRQFFIDPRYSQLPDLFPGYSLSFLHQPAKLTVLSSPTVTVLADKKLPNGHRMRLQVSSKRPGVVSLRLTWPRSIRMLCISGHIITDPKGFLPNSTHTSLLFYAPSADGVQIEVEIVGKGDHDLVVVDRSLGLPVIAGLQPLVNTMIPAPGYNSFTTQVKKRFRL